MYRDTGALMRTELAALLRQHRTQHRLGDTHAERAMLGEQVRQYRQSVLTWCSQTMQLTAPLMFSNLPARPKNPFRPPTPTTNAAAELTRELDRVTSRSAAPIASSELLTTPSENPVVERWRQAARAAALAEHDTAGEISDRLTARQAQALVGDVAAISQALVILDRRYANTPDWKILRNGPRLGWAALATALDVGLGQPDYTVDNLGWRPRVKTIDGPAKPGILGVLQAEHNLIVRLKTFPNTLNLRLVVDSQRLLSAGLTPYAAPIDDNLARHWTTRAATYTTIQQQLRDLESRIGRGAAAAAQGANAVTRLRRVPPDAIIEPRVLSGFRLLFERLDSRLADILEEGVTRGLYLQRVITPRHQPDTIELQPVRETFMPAIDATDLEVIRTARAKLRPHPRTEPLTPDPTRAELHTALIHRPDRRSEIDL